MSLKLGTTVIAGIPTGLINTVNQKLDAVTYTDNPRTNSVYLKTTYESGTAGYNIWSNGYCEQWGYVEAGATSNVISLLKTFKDMNYSVYLSLYKEGGGEAYSPTCGKSSASQFTIYSTTTGVRNAGKFWRACGYLAGGQY